MITSMLFFPEKFFCDKPENYQFSYEDVSIKTLDDVCLHGWFVQGASKKTILFFHGNAGNISGRLFKAKGWVDRGYSVLLIDYRGYGKSEGEIKHEKDLQKDGRAALDWLLQQKDLSLDDVVVYGESLGTYVATHLTAENKVAAVILEAPFTSFLDIANKHYPMIPAKETLMKDFIISNREPVSKIKSPLFILHGTLDETCAYDMGREIFELAHEPKYFFTIPEGSHNDLPERAGEEYWDKPFQFLKKYEKEKS